MQTLIVVGAGGYGQAVADAARASGQFAVVGHVDDRWPELLSAGELPVLGSTALLATLGTSAQTAVVAIGNNLLRQKLFHQVVAAGFTPATVVHPSAIISPSARLGRGVTVMAGVIVGCQSVLEDGAIASTGSIIDHHATVGAFAQLSAGACLPGGASLGAGAWLQERCTLAPGEHLSAGLISARAPTLTKST